MSSMMKFVDNLQDVHSIFLISVEEPMDNQLLLTIREAVVSNDEEYISISDKTIGPVRKVNNEGPIHQIFFDNYAAYSVFNESFLIFNNDDEYTGRLLVEFSDSAYLQNIRASSTIEHVFEEKLRHFGVYCQNHIIHIAALTEPTVS